MISIKQSMEDLEQSERRLLVLERVFARVLEALERAATVLAGDGARGFRERIGPARQQFTPQADPRVMEQSCASIEQELEQFTLEFAATLGKKEREYKDVVRLVAEAASTLTQSGSEQSEELKQFAARIESVSRLESIAEIRMQLSSRVAGLKAMADRIQREGQVKASTLERQIQRVTEQLKHAETLAETDALTGLGNRRRAEEGTRAAIASGAPFCLMVFDLNGFKSINDRCGHAQGDQLLQAVARHMRNSVREADIVCRWGGDEFVIIMNNTSLADARERAARIQSNAFGQFVLSHGGKEIRVNISASVGVAEYKFGETQSDFFERADRLCYAEKQQVTRGALPDGQGSVAY